MAPTDPAAEQAAASQQELVDALVMTSFATMAALNRIAAEHDLSLTQLRVLAILRDRRVKMSELTNFLGLDKSTVSGLVDRAEKRGLLHRAPNPHDGRGVDVFLAPSGMRLAERGVGHVAQGAAPMTSALNPAEGRRLATLLERMLEHR